MISRGASSADVSADAEVSAGADPRPGEEMTTRSMSLRNSIPGTVLPSTHFCRIIVPRCDWRTRFQSMLMSALASGWTKRSKAGSVWADTRNGTSKIDDVASKRPWCVTALTTIYRPMRRESAGVGAWEVEKNEEDAKIPFAYFLGARSSVG